MAVSDSRQAGTTIDKFMKELFPTAPITLTRAKFVQAVADEITSSFGSWEGRRIGQSEAELIAVSAFARAHGRVPGE